MKTQKHMGKKSLVKRLTAQVGGNPQLAENLLKKRGQMDDSGHLTKAGKERDNMTAGERAKDRAAKKQGGSPKDYKFNPKTNAAKKRK
jgi:hypothetical protein